MSHGAVESTDASGRSWRARSARGIWEASHGPAMTPMVDVVMVILIFFMASASIMGPEWFVRAHLPEPAPPAPGAFELPAIGVVIDLRTEGGRVVADAMGRRGIGLESLADALGTGTGGITLRAGDSVVYRDLIRAYDVCVASGFGPVAVLGR